MKYDASEHAKYLCHVWACLQEGDLECICMAGCASGRGAADFVAGMAGNALEQKIVGGKVDWGESFTSGLNNAASGLIYGTNPFGSLKSAVGRSAGVGAATALRRKTLAGQCMQEDEPVPAGGKLRGRAWVPVCGAEDECAGPEKAESWV